MTVVVVALSLALAGAVGTAFVFGRWFKQAKDEAGMAGDRLRESQRLSDEQVNAAVKDRDQWKVKHDALEQANAMLRTRLATAEIQRNRARAEERATVVDEIKRATPAVAHDVLNRVLQSLPTVP